MKFEEKLLKICKAKGLTIAFAESCTGGALASRFTKVPSASKCFAGSLVAYQDRIKTTVLGVPEQLLQKFGAASPEVADSMLENCIRLFDADCAVSVTGIAGPAKDSGNLPVGTIYIAIGSFSLGIQKFALQLTGNREEIIEHTVEIIFANVVSMLEDKMSKNESS